MLFLEPFHGKQPGPPPFWMMRQAGRYLPEYRAVRDEAGDFLTLCMTPDLAVEVTLQPIRRFGMSAAILFADILLLPHAMGQPLAYKEGEGPVLEPIRRREAVATLSDKAAERLSPVYETVRRLRSELPSDVALIGFAGAPWTVAAYMAEGRGGKGFATARRWAMSDPAGFGLLLDKVTAGTIDYLLAQVAAGADAVQLFDSWAGLLPASLFEPLVIAPTQRIVAALKERHPGLPVIGFPRGAGLHLVRYARETRVDGLSLDETVDPLWAAANLPENVVLQGNLDPQYVVAGGTAMTEETQRILEAFSRRAHVFNLGHGLVPETPPGHVAALAALLRGYGA